jgi:hypothetical protein
VHLIFLRTPTNHLDLEGLDALMLALGAWNGGVIVISHDERFASARCCLSSSTLSSGPSGCVPVEMVRSESLSSSHSFGLARDARPAGARVWTPWQQQPSLLA